MIGDRFSTCLPFTLAQECPRPDNWSDQRNFSDDKHDPGGKTFCGIIQREYDGWRKAQGLPTRDVREMTQEEGYAIYQSNYWAPECSKLAPGLDMSFFDAAVNMGTTEATKILQFVLGITTDGLWGPETDAKVAAITDVGQLINAFTFRRQSVYRMMRGYQYFGGDWIRRASEIGQESHKMVAVA